MIDVSILPHAEFRPNDHREDVPHISTRSKISTSPIIPPHYIRSLGNILSSEQFLAFTDCNKSEYIFNRRTIWNEIQ